MIVDSSAVIAILKAEATARRCALALEQATHVSMSAANYLEAMMVADSLPESDTTLSLEVILDLYAVSIVPVTKAQADIARLAHRSFGKGNDSKAKLNFGDCFAYALARERNEPLLFVGDDFTHTDIRSALA